MCIEIRIGGRWFKILNFALKELCWFDAGDGRREGGEACNEVYPGGHFAPGELQLVKEVKGGRVFFSPLGRIPGVMVGYMLL